jgi:shikimate kinase
MLCLQSPQLKMLLMQNNTKNIYLIGMPSSGKSTLGRALAVTLGYEYVDMDEMIVQNEQRSVFQIFQDSGEAYFRKIECDLLQSFLPNQKKVISTGGGVPVFFDNMAFILKNGISVYLDVLPQNLFERIYNSSKNDRPLIDKSDSEKLLENLIEKYNYRYPYYSQADIIIREDYTVAHIIEKLKKMV